MRYEPLSVRGYREMVAGRGTSAKLGVLPFLGFMPAKKQYSLSAAEKTAQELIADRAPVGGRTAEQAAKADLRYQLAADLHERKSGAAGAIRDALKAGRIDQADYRQIFDIARKDPLQHKVEHLGAEDAMKVWQVATDEEKRRILPAMFGKVAKSESIAPERARELMKQLRADRARLR